MTSPTNIQAWLRKEGFVYERVEETTSSSAVRIVAGYGSHEWRMAIVQRSGLLLLRPTSPNDRNPSMTGLFLPSLPISMPGAVAEALDHLMTTSARTQLLEGIETFHRGCLIEGLGTARAIFSAVH